MELAAALGESALRTEIGNKCNQWCDYDRLARLGVQRELDTQRMLSGAPCDSARMALREDWRLDAETQAMGAIAQQDGRVFAADTPSLGAGPSGQLRLGRNPHCSELAGLEDEELGVLHGMVSEELRRNVYRSPSEEVAPRATLWRPTADHKADAAARSLQKLRLAAGPSSISSGLMQRLRELGQAVHSCEAVLRRAQLDERIPLAADAADPLLLVCGRMRRQREAWLAAAGRALGDAPQQLLQKVRKSLVTLDKIEAFRRKHNKRRVEARHGTPTPSALNDSQTPAHPQPPAPPTPSQPLRAATPLQGEEHGRGRRLRDLIPAAPASAPAAAPASTPAAAPAAPAPAAAAPAPATAAAAPAAARAPAAVPAAAPAPAAAPPAAAAQPRRQQLAVPSGLRRAQRAAAALRLTRWVRRMLYWRRAVRVWDARAQAAAARWRRGPLAAAAASGKEAPERGTLRHRSAVAIQRVWRGCLWGRLHVRRRRRAALICQRLLRGAAVRRWLLPRIIRAARARRSRRLRAVMQRRQEEDIACAGARRELVEWQVNVQSEVSRIEWALRDEEARFRREWKAWESRLEKHCLEEIPVDDEFMEQPRQPGQDPSAPRVWMHLRTRRTQTEHPNLRLVDVHRKRQHVKVMRTREQQRGELKDRAARLSASLAQRLPELEHAVLRNIVAHYLDRRAQPATAAPR